MKKFLNISRVFWLGLLVGYIYPGYICSKSKDPLIFFLFLLLLLIPTLKHIKEEGCKAYLSHRKVALTWVCLCILLGLVVQVKDTNTTTKTTSNTSYVETTITDDSSTTTEDNMSEEVVEETTKQEESNEVVEEDPITRKQVKDALIQSIRYTASSLDLKLYKTYTKDNTIYVVIDSYKDKWRIDRYVKNYEGRYKCAILVAKYNGFGVNSTKYKENRTHYERTIAGYNLRFLYNGYSTSNKNYVWTSEYDIVIYKPLLEKNKVCYCFGHYNDDPAGYVSDAYKKKVLKADILDGLQTNTEIYNACKKDSKALKKKGVIIKKYGTIFCKNFKEPKITYKNNSSTTNYDPNDYGEAADYSDWESFYSDYDDELDADDAKELWDYWN